MKTIVDKVSTWYLMIGMTGLIYKLQQDVTGIYIAGLFMDYK